MTKRGQFHERHSNLLQRFSMAMARANNAEFLIASMLGAIAVSMGELDEEQKQEVKRLVDSDCIRVLY